MRDALRRFTSGELVIELERRGWIVEYDVGQSPRIELVIEPDARAEARQRGTFRRYNDCEPPP